ncbi:hypothetical protein ACJ73_01047 [Blastomyces percursus]|uniref:alpha-1,2-Mannosidase n=1 Tax=Blastomyces percursus TaxID=1658174 RepID=A0A1J9QGF0_9EURO|nr:hypothetical protein ACJ73_01047 [Blastomyces percursus]
MLRPRQSSKGMYQRRSTPRITATRGWREDNTSRGSEAGVPGDGSWNGTVDGEESSEDANRGGGSFEAEGRARYGLRALRNRGWDWGVRAWRGEGGVGLLLAEEDASIFELTTIAACESIEASILDAVKTIPPTTLYKLPNLRSQTLTLRAAIRMNPVLLSSLADCAAIEARRRDHVFIQRSGPDAFAPNPKYPKLPKGFAFDWKTFKEKYPVKSFVPLPSDPVTRLPRVQHVFSDEAFKGILSRQKPRQEAVKQSFIRAWDAYRSYAWMRDEVTPITKGSYDSFGGWAATLVDSLDTLWIIDLKDEFHEAVRAVANIDFTTTETEEINVFETTIRYLGGLLSAYDLSGEQSLLTKATELGNILYAAFDTPNRMPVTHWKIHSAFLGLEQEASGVCLLAEVGSLTMEFTRLSQLTKDPKWYDAVHRIIKILEERQSKTKLPGMWPLVLDARTQNFEGQVHAFTLGAMADSLYEYMPKMHALLGGVDGMYERMYKDAMAVVAKHILYRPMVPDNADILISGKVTMNVNGDVELDAEGQHLVCFAGGMFALGSRLFDIPAHMDIARKLTDGCIWAYNATPSGMMPEVFHMVPCPASEPCMWDESRYKEAVVAAHANSVFLPDDKQGDKNNSAEAIIARERLPKGIKSIEDRRYILRPEAIESVFILYRITGRTELLDTAWDMFTAIEEMTKAPFGNAALNDVTVPRGTAGDAPLSNRMESFWLAETLKYFYLMFSDPSLVSLDEYVFNTEAHPFRRKKG